MSGPFIPTPTNCDVDGHKFKGYLAWDQLDWDNAEWREKNTIWVTILGHEKAPDDPHWRVPHVKGDTFHRVRHKRRHAKAK